MCCKPVGARWVGGENRWYEGSAGDQTGDVKLVDYAASVEHVLGHPRHEQAQGMLVELIRELRACDSNEAGYEFQRKLLDLRLAVDSDRNGFSQAVKRMKSGRPVQADAPEPQSDLDVGELATWQLELDICERVARQLRCVGDALAWRVFGFQRRYILALCRNDPPGIMAGKKGLIAEREQVDRAWKENGHFALMHDLTNCLRIGDVTIFTDDGPQVIEVKSSANRRSPAQQRRITAARQAVRAMGPLPGDKRSHRLYDLDVAYETRLDLLRMATLRAASDGIFAMKVPGHRALFVTDLYGCNLQGWTPAEMSERGQRQLAAAQRKAGIAGELDYAVNATSLDSVARDPLRVPFAAYPLDPIACARLIGDLSVFVVSTSGLALADALCRAGIDADWVREPSTADLTPGEVLMELRSTVTEPLIGTVVMQLDRMMQLCRSEMDRYLIEMIEQPTWIEGIKYLMTRDKLMPRQPWPWYRDEHLTWA
jgi:hypothetical protein